MSRVLRDLGLKPDFSMVDPVKLWESQAVGKLTERYCFDLLRGATHVQVREKHCGSLRARVAANVEAFYRWKLAYEPEYIDHHRIAFSVYDRVAWETDFRCLIDGTLWLVDIKCTSGTSKDWPLQLGCGLAYDPDMCEHAAILQLKPSMNKVGYKFRDFRGSIVKSQWRRAVKKWIADREFNKLKGELGFDSEAQGLEIEEDEIEW